MRATQRITWLLLTTSVLLHIVSAQDGSQSATSVSKDNTVTAPPTAVMASTNKVTPLSTEDTNAKASTTAIVTVTPPAAETTKPTQPPTTAAPPPPAPTVTVSNKLTENTTPIKQAATVPTTVPATALAAATTLTPGASTTKTSPVTANPSTSKTLAPAATTASSSGGVAVSSSAPIIQTTKPSSVVLPGSDAPVTQPGSPGNVPTTKSTDISTDPAATVPSPTSHSSISSGTTQDGKGGTDRMTATATTRQPTASTAPQPPGNTVTTISPSTLTDAGPTTGGTSGTGAETTAPQTTINTITVAQLKTFQYSLNTGQEKDEEKELVEVCRRLMVNLQDGNCTLTWRHNSGKVQFDCVQINGKVKTSLANQIYEEINKKPTDHKTLIAILASCGALLIMIIILAVCASHHRKPYNENQQHLTEELHTVENGYHDNPTLEVMEVQPEMMEKKMALNGEFNDSWIVPIDNLLKEDMPDEEDTHL